MAPALAPDQRAVVQLVLQQERSYDDLAGLLGISADAVRARARAGLDRLADDGRSLPEDQRGEIADFLLGQLSVSRRESVRSLLAEHDDARDYAAAIADALEEMWPTAVLPEIPRAQAVAAPPPPPEPVAEPVAEPVEEAVAEPEPVAAAPEPPTPLVATPRPRPRRERGRPRKDAAAKGAQGKRSSLLGGAILIGGLAAVLAVLVIVLLSSGDDDGDTTPAETTASPTATATARPAGAIDLTAPGGGKARGQMVIFITAQGDVTFQLGAEDVPASKQGEAYAVWLTGGERPRRLGFAPSVGEDGVLATSGPRESDADRFPQWFADARNVVVSRETTGDASKPGPIVLRGQVPREGG